MVAVATVSGIGYCGSGGAVDDSVPMSVLVKMVAVTVVVAVVLAVSRLSQCRYGGDY